MPVSISLLSCSIKVSHNIILPDWLSASSPLLKFRKSVSILECILVSVLKIKLHQKNTLANKRSKWLPTILFATLFVLKQCQNWLVFRIQSYPFYVDIAKCLEILFGLFSYLLIILMTVINKCVANGLRIEIETRFVRCAN